MTALDIFVFLLIIGGAAIGFVRGLVHEVISLLGWVAAIAMLKLFHGQLSSGLDGTFGSTPAAAAVIAFALLFVPTFVLVKLLARSLGGKTRRSPLLGPVDRALGGGFGALKGLLGATLFFLLANLATDMVYGPQSDRPEWMTRSRTFPLLNASGRAIVDWVEARRLPGEQKMIRLYDTMAREKRDFEPADPQRITLYVCGPTVYGRAHIGNARPAVVFDTLVRLLRHEYGEDHVVYARNVTDVDDKIIAAAAEEGVDPSVIAERYDRFYLDDMRALGVRDPDIAPHATAEIPAMIAMIARLIDLGNAYEAESHVLFSVASDPDYGALSRRDREAMVAGARVEVAPFKRDPADFVLWKPSTPEMIGWDSPWGRGRPGWHIECSAMIAEHFGETIDIHGGGIDLVFPHHENEIAQSRCAHGGAPLARYWMHNGFVDFASEKMSKSIGNVVTPEELLAEGHRGETLRLALLSAHYRQPLPWTERLVEQAKNRLDRWYRRVGNVKPGKPDENFLELLRDDLNTPGALARLGQIKSAPILKASANLLGLLNESNEQWSGVTPQAYPFPTIGSSSTIGGTIHAAMVEGIQARIAERDAAKTARDFSTADRIRDELKAEGIILEDGPDGTTWRRA